nr:Maf family protein [Corynebacterium bovis]
MSGRPDATGRTPRRRLVLASSSPSRLSVLRSAGVEPLVVVPGTDEDAAVAALRATTPDPTPADIVTRLARAKATAVARMLREGTAGVQAPADAVILAGDSMLLIDGELQGKPHTEEATVDRWRHQRGRTAELVTGHCVIVPGAGSPDATGPPRRRHLPRPRHRHPRRAGRTGGRRDRNLDDPRPLRGRHRRRDPRLRPHRRTLGVRRGVHPGGPRRLVH